MPCTPVSARGSGWRPRSLSPRSVSGTGQSVRFLGRPRAVPCSSPPPADMAIGPTVRPRAFLPQRRCEMTRFTPNRASAGEGAAEHEILDGHLIICTIKQALDVVQQGRDGHRLCPLRQEELRDPHRLGQVGVQTFGQLTPISESGPSPFGQLAVTLARVEGRPRTTAVEGRPEVAPRSLRVQDDQRVVAGRDVLGRGPGSKRGERKIVAVRPGAALSRGR